MDKENKLWEEVENLTTKYKELNLDDMIDYNKFFIYSIIAHSTAIEGSTLTVSEVELLFEEDITSDGKLFVYHLMNKDLKEAYDYMIKLAENKKLLSDELFKLMNSLVLKSTGSVHNVIAGTFDSSKGDYRLCGVKVMGGNSYMDYKKVPMKTNELFSKINGLINNVSSNKEIYNLSFDAHYELVNIHPWVDGNGRTSRLLMNYIQLYHNVMPVKIFKEDRADYIRSLQRTTEEDNIEYFREFMGKQLIKTLSEEIKTYQKKTIDISNNLDNKKAIVEILENISNPKSVKKENNIIKI